MKKLILIFLLLATSLQAQWFTPNPKGLLRLNNTWDSTQRFKHVIIDSSLSLYNLNGNRWLYANGGDSSVTINGQINYNHGLSPVLPDTIFMALGQEYNIYWHNIINRYDYQNYKYEVTCDSGKTLAQGFRFTPSGTSTLKLYLSIYDQSNNRLTYDSTVLKANAKLSSNQKILLIGNSLTSSASYRDELEVLGDSNITLIGTSNVDSTYIHTRSWEYAGDKSYSYPPSGSYGWELYMDSTRTFRETLVRLYGNGTPNMTYRLYKKYGERFVNEDSLTSLIYVDSVQIPAGSSNQDPNGYQKITWSSVHTIPEGYYVYVFGKKNSGTSPYIRIWDSLSYAEPQRTQFLFSLTGAWTDSWLYSGSNTDLQVPMKLVNYDGEGNSGKTYQWFALNELSPFVNSGVIDLDNYFATVPTPDKIIFELGTNELYSLTNLNGTDSYIDNYINTNIFPSMDALIDSFRVKCPSAKIGVSFVHPPAYSQDAFANNYQNMQGWKYKRVVHRFNELLKLKFATPTRASLIPYFVGIDTEHNMLSDAAVYNARNSSTYIMQNNGVHPALSGYWQMADYIWGWICKDTDIPAE